MGLRLEPREEGELGDEDGAPNEAARGDQALGGDLTAAVDDRLELLVAVLDGARAQFVEQAADFDAVVRPCADSARAAS
jgi:hypothetical protein